MQLAPRQLDLFRQPQRPAAQAPARLAQAEPPPTPEPDDAPDDAPSREAALRGAHALAQQLANHLGPSVRVSLRLHDNRSTMVSFRRQPPLLHLRLHHMFLHAPDDVVQALAEYAGHGRKSAGRRIDDFIAAQQERIRTLPRRGQVLKARGRSFDLQELFDALNDTLFQGGIRARIGWGRSGAKRRKKSIRLGVYDHKLREIRLHPVLDSPDVPRFFVEFIVFHEMLHQLFPSDRHSGRHVHHPKAFRDREKAFPHYDAAMRWEKEHLKQLLAGSLPAGTRATLP